MIDAYEAIKIFKSIEHEYVGTIFDVGHSFIISSVDENGDDMYLNPVAINKETGELTEYFPPDHWDEFENAIEIDYTEIKHS